MTSLKVFNTEDVISSIKILCEFSPGTPWGSGTLVQTLHGGPSSSSAPWPAAQQAPAPACFSGLWHTHHIPAAPSQPSDPPPQHRTRHPPQKPAVVSCSGDGQTSELISEMSSCLGAAPGPLAREEHPPPQHSPSLQGTGRKTSGSHHLDITTQPRPELPGHLSFWTSWGDIESFL